MTRLLYVFKQGNKILAKIFEQDKKYIVEWKKVNHNT